MRLGKVGRARRARLQQLAGGTVLFQKEALYVREWLNRDEVELGSANAGQRSGNFQWL